MRTVIAFDVCSDRRRARLVSRLRSWAERVQKSVFEAPSLEPGAYLRMRSEIEALVDRREDRVRYYRMCAACAARTEHVGPGPGPIAPAEPFRIVGGE